MKRPTPLICRRASRRRPVALRAFTLLELLVAMGVFVVLLGCLLSVSGHVQKAWSNGEKMVEVQQSGRATLDLIAREMAPAAISNRLQFVQNPDISGLVPHDYSQADSLFWVAPIKSTNAGNLCGVGYYLTRNPSAGEYRLNRFMVEPRIPDPGNPNDLSKLYKVGEKLVSPVNASWLTDLPSSAFDPSPTNTGRAVSVVADGVVALWFRCFDLAGNPIPFLNQDGRYSSAGPMKFNSAVAFRMAVPPNKFDGGKTFIYTAAPPSTPTLQFGSSYSAPMPAHRLPATVEVTIVVLDSKSIKRRPNIPPMPEADNPEEVPKLAEEYRQQLVNLGHTGTAVFTTRIRLINGTP